MNYKEYKMGIIDDGEWEYENRDKLHDDAVWTERCENCRWYRYSEVDDEYVCVNSKSEYCAEQMSDDDYCDEWKMKHEEK